MQFYISKSIVCKERFEFLLKRFANLRNQEFSKASSLLPLLSTAAEENEKLIESSVKEINDMVQNLLIFPKRLKVCAAFLKSKRDELFLREKCYDSLERYAQQANSLSESFVRGIYGCLQDIYTYLGTTTNCVPLLSYSSSIGFPVRELCIQRSAMENVIDLSILVHEVAHDVSTIKAFLLEALFMAIYEARDEFSRRYGIRQIALDKLVSQIKMTNGKTHEFYEDIQAYLSHNTDILDKFLSLLGLQLFFEREQFYEEWKKVRNNAIDLIPEIGPYINLVVKALVEVQAHVGWLHEMFADIVATRIMGPVFFGAMLELMTPEASHFKFKSMHPPDTFRIYYIKEILQKMEFKSIADDKWRGWYESLPDLIKDKFDYYTPYLNDLIDFILEHVEKMEGLCPPFSCEDFSDSQGNANELEKGKLVDIEARKILNATWIVLQNGGNKETVNKAAWASLGLRYKNHQSCIV